MTVALNGIEAIDRMKEKAFDLVLMDIEMPEMDGLEASSLIRSGKAGPENADIPIIAMTAHVLNDMIETYHATGINHSITKPISINNLDDIIQMVIEEHRKM